LEWAYPENVKYYMPNENLTANRSRSVNEVNPNTWVHLHADYLYKFGLSRVKDEEQAKDLVQETFLAAFENKGTFKGKCSERTWLSAILVNKTIDSYRRNARFPITCKLTEIYAEQDHLLESECGYMLRNLLPQDLVVDEDILLKREFEQVLKACLKKLPSLWYRVFTRKYLDGESTDTICSELSLSASNVWVILHRSKLNLRKDLQRIWL
jgi:RNA polymerase sigma-70 factor (TIGR02943 family)